MLIPIEEHELLVFWVQLLALLSFAHAFGWLARRVGLPSVIGQLLAGLVLGPSVFGGRVFVGPQAVPPPEDPCPEKLFLDLHDVEVESSQTPKVFTK